MNQKQQIKFLLTFLFLLHRSKRAIPADMYCGTRNVVTLYTHHTECHCKPGFQKRFCEQGINLPFSSHYFKERVVDSYLTFILRQELQNLIVIEKLFFLWPSERLLKEFNTLGLLNGLGRKYLLIWSSSYEDKDVIPKYAFY